MISTKEKKMTPEDRKQKVKDLHVEHENYFSSTDMSNSVYIPKMAYRPSGKDELHISFFPSELEKGNSIYTEFVSIDYESEDPKRTLYLWKYNKHWKEEYELIESSSGFQRHIIPVGELQVISDINSRNGVKKQIQNILSLDELKPSSNSNVEDQLEKIYDQLVIMTHYLKQK